MRQNGATSLLMLTIAGFWYQMAGGPVSYTHLTLPTIA